MGDALDESRSSSGPNGERRLITLHLPPGGPMWFAVASSVAKSVISFMRGLRGLRRWRRQRRWSCPPVGEVTHATCLSSIAAQQRPVLILFSELAWR